MNSNSSIGLIEELWTNLMNKLAQEYHLRIIRDKVYSQLENRLIEDDSIEDATLKLDFVQNDLLPQVTEQRRAVQRKILSIAENNNQPVDNDFWCTVKHGAIDVITLFESLQATNFEDIELLDVYNDTVKTVNSYISMWLGGSIISCAACLADRLKEVEGSE